MQNAIESAPVCVPPGGFTCRLVDLNDGYYATLSFSSAVPPVPTLSLWFTATDCSGAADITVVDYAPTGCTQDAGDARFAYSLTPPPP